MKKSLRVSLAVVLTLVGLSLLYLNNTGILPIDRPCVDTKEIY
jgi:hypothetical protein